MRTFVDSAQESVAVSAELESKFKLFPMVGKAFFVVVVGKCFRIESTFKKMHNFLSE